MSALAGALVPEGPRKAPDYPGPRDGTRGRAIECMLAEYVAWHLREAWRPMLFADEDQAAKGQRDPVQQRALDLAAQIRV